MTASKLHRLVFFVTLILTTAGMTAVAGGGARTPPVPPSTARLESAMPAEARPSQVQDLPRLKAVLIVGPIDGDDGQGTLAAIDSMEDAADELEANGVEVHRFYTPNNDWPDIRQAADGAHFLLYRGHGVYWPYLSDFPHPHVGGFALKNQFVSSDDIRQDLKLAQNAVVMLYGCFTAGTSSVDSDDIGLEEARRRVAQYSDPFFDVGAAGYYANWFSSAFQMFVRYLFQGQTLGQAYQSYFDFNPETVSHTTHPDHPQLSLWLDKDHWDGYWQYNNAFAGLPDEKLQTLFAPPTLGDLPDALSYTYNIPEGELLPTAHQVTPKNAGSDDALTWTLAAEGGWFAVDPLNGTTPAPLWITPTSFSTSSPVTYAGAVTVTVTDPVDVEGSPHRIDLTLRVTDASLAHAYLPLALRSYTSLPQAQHPDDPYYVGGLQWPLNEVNAPRAWGLSTGEDVLIAVLDSGADLDHPDLIGKLRTDIDKDFVTGDHGDDVANDDHGHGTHVAGIAAAATDNGIGVAGLGWESTILPLKVLDSTGDGDGMTLTAAIRYAADHGADVINMSLGGPTDCPDSVQSAVDYAYAKGVLLVAAAGNHGGDNGPNTQVFPANCEHVLGVAAADPDDSVAGYSNYGGHVSVAAPGSLIYSTAWAADGDPYCTGTDYCYKSGTSMATPHVAGLAALVRAHCPSYTPDQIASALLDNAVDLGAAGWNQYSGCGRIDAFEALWKGAQGPSPLCLEGVGPWAAGVRETRTEAPFVPGEIIVAFRPNAQTEALSLRYGASVEFMPALEAWRLRVSPGQEQAVLQRLRADPAVAYAELNYLVSAQ